MTVNGDRIKKGAVDIEGLKDFEIIFGKSLYKNFSTTDVCPMSIKNIKIFNNKNILIRNWVLGKHSKSNKVFDEIKNKIAIVENPIWLIDQHVFWKNNANFQFDGLLGTAQDIEGDRIFFIDRKAVYVYSPIDQVMDTLNYTGSPFPCLANTFIYNPNYNELWSYSFDENIINKFDFNNLKWSHNKTDCIETSYWHHNKIISPKDSSLITYGGYGFYQYKSDLKNFNDKTSAWITIDQRNSITPRYLSSSGLLNNDQFLIFGGFGSETGNQSVNSHHYYDLYSINFDDFQVNKIWNITNSQHPPFVPIGSMVIDSNSDSFYTLIYDNSKYNTNLKLVSFGINEYEMTVFSDSIPYKFLDIESNSSFFLDSKKSKLLALTFNGDNVGLFSLTYPPLQSSEVFVDEQESGLLRKSLVYMGIFIGILIALLTLTFLIVKFRRKSDEYRDENYETSPGFHKLAAPKPERRLISSIYLFGGFQVYDIDGKDITVMFTPTLKELFLLILLTGFKSEKGITSFKLTEILWSDKSEKSARNNRNVNISKLRLLLERIGDIELRHDNTYWTMNYGESVFCDYCFVHKFMDELTNDSLEEEKVYHFIGVVSEGEICPDIQTEWMDEFKNEVADILIDNLEQFVETPREPHMNILIANTILKFSPLNEVAISLKCKGLYAIGKKGLARKSYNNFCKEYFSLLDSKFNTSFKDLIS